jgi:hypothetical protein
MRRGELVSDAPGSWRFPQTVVQAITVSAFRRAATSHACPWWHNTTRPFLPSTRGLERLERADVKAERR